MAASAPNGSAALQRWLTIGAIALGLIAPIVGGGWWLSNLNGRVSTLENQQPRDSSLTQTKLDELMRRMGAVNAAIQTLEIAQADDCQQFAKIETQFGITETVINKDNIDNQRHKDAVNAKIFGITPSGIYYEIKIPHEIQNCGH